MRVSRAYVQRTACFRLFEDNFANLSVIVIPASFVISQKIHIVSEMWYFTITTSSLDNGDF